jgi:hypothetical protein
MTKRDDVEKYVNLIKIEFAESIELDLSIFFTIKFDATNSTDLSIDEQRDFAILREDYKKKMRKYKKRIDVLKNLNIFIFTSVNRFNLIYFRNQETIHQKLTALKKRLASTNSIRKLEMIRKYKNLQKALNHQQMNQWLLNWKKIMRKRNDWICLMCKTIDAHTIFWIRCEQWICHLCLIKRRFSIMKWIRKNLRRQ